MEPRRMRSHCAGPCVTPPPRPRGMRTPSPSQSPSPTVVTPPGSPMDVDPPLSPPRLRRPVISVFDWDDTLCPSSWLFREGLLAGYGLVDEPPPPEESSYGCAKGPQAHRRSRELTPEDRELLRQLGDQVLALLHAARQCGPVFIVTAAKLQWVRNTAECFLPSVFHVLAKSESLHVISAREFYMDQARKVSPEPAPVGAMEGTPLAWKCVTFDAVCAHLRVEEVHRQSRLPSSKIDFVSVGDSFCERDACRLLEMKAPHMLRAKTVKLVNQPSLVDLVEQVNMTRSMYQQICRHAASLDLHMLRTRAGLRLIQVDLPTAAAAAAPAAHQPPRPDREPASETSPGPVPAHGGGACTDL
ncbi:hypothetical protein P43SY_004278 [Pythium insidiosum]|uniref:Protein kinase n=1 Tax=Pythium insidiosum TaxID=114742 RepID=A0AAD5LAC9_PYTIN|nr:hypothetical protein P43SY_004278 [Pythium insidiosum]